MKTLHQILQVTTVKKSEHLYFSFLDFCFFNESEGGNAVFFGKPLPLAQLFVAPYILLMEAIYFGGKRYFVKFGQHVVGIFILQEMPETLCIRSLAVNPSYRRLGIGTYILTYTEKLAKSTSKKWLELSVLKTNIPALRLYKKSSFIKKKERKRSLTLWKKVEAH